MNKAIKAVVVLVCSGSILTGCTNEPEAEVSTRLAILPNHAQTLSLFGDTLFSPRGEGIEKHPEDARIYRHRGHRHITLRMLDEAIADFEHASQLIEGEEDQIEPDGIGEEGCRLCNVKYLTPSTV
jgi:hypothetical protein